MDLSSLRCDDVEIFSLEAVVLTLTIEDDGISKESPTSIDSSVAVICGPRALGGGIGIPFSILMFIVRMLSVFLVCRSGEGFHRALA